MKSQAAATPRSLDAILYELLQPPQTQTSTSTATEVSNNGRGLFDFHPTLTKNLYSI